MFRPPYSPNINFIDMVSSKRKTALLARFERNITAL